MSSGHFAIHQGNGFCCRFCGVLFPVENESLRHELAEHAERRVFCLTHGRHESFFEHMSHISPQIDSFGASVGFPSVAASVQTANNGSTPILAAPQTMAKRSFVVSNEDKAFALVSSNSQGKRRRSGSVGGQDDVDIDEL